MLLRKVATAYIAIMQNAQAEETEQKPWVSKRGGDFLEFTLSNLWSPLTQILSDKPFHT